MSGTVSMLRPKALNPATRPELTDTLKSAVESRAVAAREVLAAAAAEFGNSGEVTFANSFA